MLLPLVLVLWCLLMLCSCVCWQSDGGGGPGRWVRREDYALRDEVQRERLLYQRERALASRLRDLLAMEEAEVITVPSRATVPIHVTPSEPTTGITSALLSADLTSASAAASATACNNLHATTPGGSVSCYPIISAADGADTVESVLVPVT
jgi:hypothetical protein